MKKFERIIEDFTCEQCGAFVIGNGFTNHCPNCLWSKDVDINPGDRASECLGLMKPVEVLSERDGYVIVHKCQKCGKLKRNKCAPNDSFDAIIKVQNEVAKGLLG